MTRHVESVVGSRIRTLREHRGLSLRSLADKSGLSFNAISLIERGENSPTVSSLHALAAALDVKITEFFEESQEQAVVFVKHDKRPRSEGSGIVMESLGIGLRHQVLEPFLMTIDVNAHSTDNLITHPGQEFVYCVHGEFDYRIADQIYHLEPGDSLLFQATQPHCFCNRGTLPAVALFVFGAAEGNPVSRPYHLDA